MLYNRRMKAAICGNMWRFTIHPKRNACVEVAGELPLRRGNNFLRGRRGKKKSTYSIDVVTAFKSVKVDCSQIKLENTT